MLPRWLSGTRGESRSATVAALGALWLGTFCVSTTENLPAGLLPQMSAGLGVSLSAVGQLVTGYAVTVAVLSVPLTHATSRIPRRPLLAGLMALFVLASLGSALAPGYGLLLASRVAAAVVHAVWWAVVTVAAMSLFQPAVRGRVMAVLNGATAVATVLGVPAGAWLGQLAGWRAAFAGLCAASLAALAANIAFLPSAAAAIVPATGPAAKGTRPDARRYAVLLVTIVLVMTGLSMAFTYTVPFLTDVSGFPVRAISPLLLLLRGAAGVASMAVAGSLADRSSMKLATIPSVAALSVAFLGLFTAGTDPVAAAVFVALSGAGLFTMLTTLTSEALAVAPASRYLASAGASAAFNAGAALGALGGGPILAAFGVRSTALVAGLLAAAAVAVLLADQLTARRTASQTKHPPFRIIKHKWPAAGEETPDPWRG
jgi:DHA1 family inner membrane transport protein